MVHDQTYYQHFQWYISLSHSGTDLETIKLSIIDVDLYISLIYVNLI